MNNTYNQAKAELRESFFRFNSQINNAQTLSFLKAIYDKTPNSGRILDIGTGNGFVLEQLAKVLGKDFQFYGMDNSEEMLKIARIKLKGLPIELFFGDNFGIPFKEDYFDSVTAKNVTNFSATEVYRVLKSRGIFFFKEYGKGKGLEELAEIFKGRLIRSREPNFYIGELFGAGFRDIELKEDHIPRDYTQNELLKIVKMFPFIEGFVAEDEQKIIAMFQNRGTITINSDPLIITAVK